jgi:hypothetical protein
MFHSSETSVITNQHGVIPYKIAIFINSAVNTSHDILIAVLSSSAVKLLTTSYLGCVGAKWAQMADENQQAKSSVMGNIVTAVN